MSEGWAIAGCFYGAPHLYYAAVQFEPVGSLTLVRLEDRMPFMRPMTFFSEKVAKAALDTIVLRKKLAKFLEWKVVFLEGY